MYYPPQLLRPIRLLSPTYLPTTAGGGPCWERSRGRGNYYKHNIQLVHVHAQRWHALTRTMYFLTAHNFSCDKTNFKTKKNTFSSIYLDQRFDFTIPAYTDIRVSLFLYFNQYQAVYRHAPPAPCPILELHSADPNTSSTTG